MVQVVLLFPEPFWGEKDMFGRVAELSEQRGEFYLFYSYAGISGGAVLAALVSGDAAKEFEEMSCEQATQRVMRFLRSVFLPRGIYVPAPLQVLPCCPWLLSLARSRSAAAGGCSMATRATAEIACLVGGRYGNGWRWRGGRV